LIQPRLGEGTQTGGVEPRWPGAAVRLPRLQQAAGEHRAIGVCDQHGKRAGVEEAAGHHRRPGAPEQARGQRAQIHQRA
jgi:hypothetical protein